MIKLIVSFLMVCMSFYGFSQSQLVPDNFLISIGSYQMKNKASGVGNASTNSLDLGAEWKWKITTRSGINSSILGGLYFPSFTFSDGVRPYILIPCTYYYQANSKFEFNVGIFFRADFYNNFRTSSFDTTGKSGFHDWELPVTNSTYFGAIGSVRYLISNRLSCGIDLNYIPTIKVKEVTNDPYQPTEKYYSLSPKLSLYYRPLIPKTN
jgi:hypothetical protein